jgi:hypothetical protein
LGAELSTDNSEKFHPEKENDGATGEENTSINDNDWYIL